MFRSVAVALSLGLVGCATAPTPTARMQKPTAISSTRVQTDATGVWDWMFRSQDDQGDERVEQEEWHLAQRGARVEGYYDRKVTMLSVDERLFRWYEEAAGYKIRTVPRSFAVCGMTLSVVPAWNMQIDTTADFSGSTLRDTIDWMLLMIWAPTRTVSIDRCGRAAWPPMPSMSIVTMSADAIAGPGRMPNWPTGRPGALCMP